METPLPVSNELDISPSIGRMEYGIFRIDVHKCPKHA